MRVKWKGRSLLFRELGEGSWGRKLLNQKVIPLHLENFFVVGSFEVALPAKSDPKQLLSLGLFLFLFFLICNTHLLKYSSCHQSSYKFHPSRCPSSYNESNSSSPRRYLSSASVEQANLGTEVIFIIPPKLSTVSLHGIS